MNGNYIKYDELYDKVASNIDLVITILDSKNINIVKQKILNNCAFNKDISLSTIRKLRETLNKNKEDWLGRKKNLDIQTINQTHLTNGTSPDSVELKKSDKTLPNNSINQNSTTKNSPEKAITSEQIIAQEDSNIKEVVSISKDISLKIQTLTNEIIELKQLCTSLHNEKLILTSTLNNITNKEKSSTENVEDDKVKDLFFSILKERNKLLNINKDGVPVVVNKEVLSIVARFIDEHALINLEEVISKGFDINSTIVQLILLAFIQENSLF